MNDKTVTSLLEPRISEGGKWQTWKVAANFDYVVILLFAFLNEMFYDLLVYIFQGCIMHAISANR